LKSFQILVVVVRENLHTRGHLEAAVGAASVLRRPSQYRDRR